MATQPLPTHEEIAKHLKDYAHQAGVMEDILRQAVAVLDAIIMGGLQDAAPADDRDYCMHSAASVLLDMLRSKLRNFEQMPGTNLSISLHVAADDLAKGRPLTGRAQ